MQDQLDPTVVNLAKAIRQTESGGNFNAKGKSGEHGGYQFTPDTWNATAPKYGINVPIEQATPEQQNAVAYNKIKSWKDSGHDVTQIASMWNAGEAEPTAYTGKFGTTTSTHDAGDPSTGVNKFGAKYDVPAYAKSVANAYLTLKNGGQVQADASNPSSTANPQNQPTEDNMLQKIAHGAGSVLNAIEKPFIGAGAIPVQMLAKAMGRPDPYAQGFPSLTGENIPVSDLNLEKKAGDIAQVASYLVPGEGILGAVGMGALQGAGGAMSEGKNASDVATSGITGSALGAGTAGLTKLAGMGISKLGENISGKTNEKAIQGIKDAYGSALNLNAGERAFESKSGKDLSQVLLNHNAPLGRYENGTLDASAAIAKLQDPLDALNAQAKSVLSNPQGVVANVSLEDTFNQVQKRIQELQISQAEKNTAIKHAKSLFDAEAQQYGVEVTPEIADTIKQGMWGSSFKGNLTTADKLQGNVSYLASNTLKTNIEKAVAGTDAGNVLPEINKQRSDLIDAIKRLTNLDGVRVLKGGKLGNMAGGLTGTIIGGASGGTMGALAGDYFGTKAAEFLNNPATKIGIAKGKAKVAGLIPTLLGNKAVPIGNAISKVGTGVKKSARIGGLMGNLIGQ